MQHLLHNINDAKFSSLSFRFVSPLVAADKPATVLYDVPKNARVVNGSCADNDQFIQLVWGPESVEKNRLMVSFRRNTTEHEFALSGMSFYLVIFGEQFPNAKGMCLYSLSSSVLKLTFECPHCRQANSHPGKQSNPIQDPDGHVLPLQPAPEAQLDRE